VTTIEEKTFYGCTGLISVTIPGSVTTIELDAFNACTVLVTVIFDAGSAITTQWNNRTFSYIDVTAGYSGDKLWNAYIGGGSKSGTYTRGSGSYATTWTQQP
jgi:hypothetical protein